MYLNTEISKSYFKQIWKKKNPRSRFLWFPSRLSSALPYIPLICNSCTTDFSSSKVAPKNFCQLWKDKIVPEAIKRKTKKKWSDRVKKQPLYLHYAAYWLRFQGFIWEVESTRKFMMIFLPFPFFCFPLFSLYIGGEESTCVFPRRRICICGLSTALLNTEKQN